MVTIRSDVLDDVAADLLAGRHPGGCAGSSSEAEAPSVDAPPGVVLAVSHRGSTTAVAHGFRQRLSGRRPLRIGGSASDTLVVLDDPLPMTTTSQFDAASITKMIGTTAALMRLVDDDALDLDDPVARYLPGFADGAKAAVRISDLLRHRGGLAPWWPLYIDASTPAEARALAASLPLSAAPDTVRVYSDLGFILLGQVIETAAGAPLADTVQDLVLAPLGMTATGFAGPVYAGGEIAAGGVGDIAEFRMIATDEPYPVPYDTTDFQGWREAVIVDEINDGNAFHAFDGDSGHAGLFTTAGDLLRFGDALLRAISGDGPWRRDTVERFVSPGPDTDQALGFRREAHDVGGRVVTAIGHPGYTGSTAVAIPDLDATVVMATNRLHVTGTPTQRDPMWHHAIDRILPSLA